MTWTFRHCFRPGGTDFRQGSSLPFLHNYCWTRMVYRMNLHCTGLGPTLSRKIIIHTAQNTELSLCVAADIAQNTELCLCVVADIAQNTELSLCVAADIAQN